MKLSKSSEAKPVQKAVSVLLETGVTLEKALSNSQLRVIMNPDPLILVCNAHQALFIGQPAQAEAALSLTSPCSQHKRCCISGFPDLPCLFSPLDMPSPLGYYQNLLIWLHFHISACTMYSDAGPVRYCSSGLFKTSALLLCLLLEEDG